MEGIAFGPDGGERLQRTSGHHRILCELPALEVLELRFGSDFEGVALHTHADHTDCFYVLDGRAQFTIDGKAFTGGPGSFVAAPTGTVHGFQNAGDGELRMLNIHAPTTGFADRLRGE